MTMVLFAAAGVLVFAGGSGAQQGHGIGGSTICQSPTPIGQDIMCSYTVRNNSDDFNDTLRAYFVEENVAGAAGNDPSGNIFEALQWTAEGTPGVTCWKDNGLTNPAVARTIPADGTGTAADPFRNAKYCDLPSTSRIVSNFYGYHTATVADYFADPLHRIATSPTYRALDLCDGMPGGSPNCPTVPLEISPGSQTTITAQPAIIIEKFTNDEDADTPTGPEIPVGGAVTWKYIVTNDGNAPLSNVTVTDNVIGPITCPQNTLAIGADMECTATGVAQPGQYANVGTATGVFDGTTVQDTDPSHYFGVQPALTLVKRTNQTDDQCPAVAVGSTVTWSYQVTNTGNVVLTNILVRDDNGTPGNPADDFTVGTIASLAPGASTTLTATGTALPGAYANIATASTSYTASGTTVPVSATEDDCYFGAAPRINIEKATNGQDADTPTGPVVPVGGTVTWTYVVTNTGNVALTNVSVLDSDIGPVLCPNNTLAVGASMTCTATGTATAGQYANVGTATGTGGGQTVNDTDPSHYFGAAPALDLVKRTNGTDSQCPTGPVVPVGSTVTWTYAVTNTGNVPLTNIVVVDDNGTPGNPADDVTVGTIAGPLAPGGTATLTLTGTAAAGQYTNVATASTSFATSTTTIPVSDTDNDCYFGGNPSINIEKATNGQDADTPTGPVVPVGSTVTWTFVVTNTGNVPLTGVAVTDNVIGAITCPATTLAVGASMTCTATGVATAGQYANIGTATGTGGGQTVNDTDPSHYFGETPPPGGPGFTIGFWKNHSSCAKGNGNQDPVLDQTLATAPGGGIMFGTLFVDTCQEAVALLDKRSLNGKSQSSDPLFNLAAQLLAADLNVLGGAATCAAVTNAITEAHQLLVTFAFNGNTHAQLTTAAATRANQLAELLDAYNNNNAKACA